MLRAAVLAEWVGIGGWSVVALRPNCAPRELYCELNVSGTLRSSKLSTWADGPRFKLVQGWARGERLPGCSPCGPSAEVGVACGLTMPVTTARISKPPGVIPVSVRLVV